MWTISVELQFYVVTPLIAYLVARRVAYWTPLFVLLLVANFVFWNVLDQQGLLFKLVNVSFVPWLYMFVAGAWLSTRRDVIGRIRALPLVVPVLSFGFAVFLTRLVGQNAGGNNINPLMFMALAVLVVRLAYTAPNLSGRLLRGNDISYGIYIYHMPIVNFALWYGFMGSWLAVGVALVASAALALASWTVLERPAILAARGR